MDVDDPSELSPFLVPVKMFNPAIREIKKRRGPVSTYVVSKKPAIILKISVSLEVLSNPGVSMRTTLLPLRVNGFASWTSADDGCTQRFEPLARLTNWGQPGEFLVIVTKYKLLTDVFPLPVAPMILWKR